MEADWFHTIKKLTALLYPELSCPFWWIHPKRGRTVVRFHIGIFLVWKTEILSEFSLCWCCFSIDVPLPTFSDLLQACAAFLGSLALCYHQREQEKWPFQVNSLLKYWLGGVGRGSPVSVWLCFTLKPSNIVPLALSASQIWEPAEGIWWNRYLRQLRSRLEHRLSYQSLQDRPGDMKELGRFSAHSVLQVQKRGCLRISLYFSFSWIRSEMDKVVALPARCLTVSESAPNQYPGRDKIRK